MSLGLEGKSALVTGGGSGIGAQTCEALVSAGASVIIADYNVEQASALAHRLKLKGR